MKHVFFAILSLCSLAILAATPTAEDLKDYYSSGQVCICVQFAQPVCNDIVWCGTYNGWNVGNVSQLVRFKAVTNFDGWYVVAFDDSKSDIRGKAVQLKSDGSFDWQYQTGKASTWNIISGSATIHDDGESELRNISKQQPLIITSSAWKKNVCTAGKAYSGTLPVLFINTENSTPITSKEDYLKASYYLDNLGLSGYTSIASKEKPDTMQIKGRGNYTWKDFDKKPYRLKLNNKQALMGLEKSKHWTLLAHADDQFCWMKNTIGFALSEQMGMKWTPKQAALEVVLNGDYIGLYMLTEQIRIDKKRVNIIEQADQETDLEKITGGWLVEIDNYEEPYHVTVVEPANKWHGEQIIWFTPKTPEVLSTAQTNYLQGQMDAINKALYEDTETNLVKILDIEEAAKYYLVCELMSDCESYHGSCYLHKDQNDNANENPKWYFGPVWDFGNSFRDQNKFIYDDPTWSQNWIGQLAGKKAFIAQRDSLWKHWKSYDYTKIEAVADSFALLIADAANADAERWPKYDHSNVQQGKTVFKNYFRTHVNWLTTQWGDATTTPSIWNDELGIKKVMINGHLYIIRDEKVYTIMGSGASADQLQ